MFNYKITVLDVEVKDNELKVNQSKQAKKSDNEFTREIPAYDSDEREL